MVKIIILPKKANIGVINAESIVFKKTISDPNNIQVAAPKAPPVETPIRDESTKGFLKRPCRAAPETPRANPTEKPRSVLGILIVSTIIAFPLKTSERPIVFIEPIIMSLRGIETGPLLMDIKIIASPKQLKREKKTLLIFVDFDES